MWKQQLLFSHSLHALPCVEQLCLMLSCHGQLMPANPGELERNSLRQRRREEQSSGRGRQRSRWHVSTELQQGRRRPRPWHGSPAELSDEGG